MPGFPEPFDMTEEEFALLANKPKSTIKCMRWRGQLPVRYERIGRSVRYRRSDVLAYLASCVVTPEAE